MLIPTLMGLSKEDDKHLFDFSNYDKDHSLYDTSNAKTPGLFKDETREC
jgi:hypothetical protein